MTRPTKYVMAVDVGQAHDYTAVVTLESYPTYTEVPFEPIVEGRRFDMVHAERFREIPYPAQIARVKERYREVEKSIADERKDATTALIVDATGVGKPILDAFHDEGLRPKGVIITGGDEATSGGGMMRVPKRELVTTLQVALQAKRLKIAEKLDLAETILDELRGFRVKITLAGHARFGNDVGDWRREGADHDDLVLATALAVWYLDWGPRPGTLRKLRRAQGLKVA